MSFLRWYLTALVACFFYSAEALATGWDEEKGRATILFQGGVSGLFDGEKNPLLGIEYRGPVWTAGLSPWIAATWATDGAVFIGGGLARTWRLTEGWELGAGFGPGYYDRHEGADLGSHLEFYSYAELTRKITARQSLCVRLAHISNGSLADRNPGTEILTIGCRVCLP